MLWCMKAHNKTEEYVKGLGFEYILEINKINFQDQLSNKTL